MKTTHKSYAAISLASLLLLGATSLEATTACTVDPLQGAETIALSFSILGTLDVGYGGSRLFEGEPALELELQEALAARIGDTIRLLVTGQR